MRNAVTLRSEGVHSLNVLMLSECGSLLLLNPELSIWILSQREVSSGGGGVVSRDIAIFSLFFLVFISSEISNGPACANFLTNTGKIQNTFSSIQDCKTKEKKLGVKNSPSLLAFDPVTVLDYAGFLSRTLRCFQRRSAIKTLHSYFTEAFSSWYFTFCEFPFRLSGL